MRGCSRGPGRRTERNTRERDTEAKRADGNTFREREPRDKRERERRRQRWRIREK